MTGMSHPSDWWLHRLASNENLKIQSERSTKQ